jgi:hypothetical protein
MRQVTATAGLAIAPICLGVEEFGLAHQGVDLQRQLLFGPEHPLVTQVHVLADFGFHLGAMKGHVPKAHHAGLLAQPQYLNE